jgi:hypothetical protein
MAANAVRSVIWVKQFPSFAKPIPALRAWQAPYSWPPVHDLGGEGRMARHLDRQMAPLGVHGVERVVVDVGGFFARLRSTPLGERSTSYTVAPARATRIKNTPVPTVWLAR